MEQKIETSSGTVCCTVTRKKMKNMRIRVTADGRVAVSAPPHIAQNRIRAFVAQNAAYILRRQRQTEAKRRRSYPAAYASGDVFRFLGQRIELVAEPAQRESAVMLTDRLVLRVPAHRTAKQVFEKWMARAAREVFAGRLALLARRFAAQGVCLSVKRMLTRWGSINTKSRRLSLTVHLARCEQELIDYVITHELCHLKCARHSEEFYRELERHFPDRRALDKRLEAYGLVDF